MVLNSKINFKQAILSTFAFFDMFDYPLSQEEVEEYLFRLPLDQRQIEIYLKNSALLSYSDGLYCFKGREDIFVKNQERSRLAKKHWKKINRMRKVLNWIPFIRLVAVANNLSYDNPKSNSDIDLLVVTTPERLFTSRLLLTIWTHLFRVRRHGKKVAGRFCLSFYITEDCLDLSHIALEEEDIYLAYWFKTLQPIAGTYQTYIDLIDHNRKFLEDYFDRAPNYQKRHFRRAKGFPDALKRLQEKLLGGKFGEWLEKKLRDWQLNRAHKKMEEVDPKDASIIVSDKILKFHNIDRREYYLKRWKKVMSELT